MSIPMPPISRAKKKFGNLEIDQTVKKAVEQTFDINSKVLPSGKIIKPFLKEESLSLTKGILDIMLDDKSFLTPYYLRELYLEHSFVVYTDEMLNTLRTFCNSKGLKHINELCCGTGWFSHWMKKYGIPLQNAVDNKTWFDYKKHDKFLPIVRKDDAVQFVRNNPQTDMFVLSWPYMDPLARMIWDNMRAGQYLLYIGEGEGGCTADDSFFEAVRNHEITNNKEFNLFKKEFIQFRGLYDRPELYLKP